jgi:predicted nucleic acid-binding protein
VKLVDTAVAVDHLRGNQAAVELLQRLIEQNESLAASELVRFELLAGVREDEVEALEEFFAALAWVPVGDEIARSAGLLARKHRRTYSGIDDVDYVIAATALMLDAELLTTNMRHFPMLHDLRPAY